MPHFAALGTYIISYIRVLVPNGVYLLKEGFEPKSFKNYNLTLEEQKELDKFLDENLEKRYI
jgi:hypothetical protein